MTHLIVAYRLDRRAHMENLSYTTPEQQARARARLDEIDQLADAAPVVKTVRAEDVEYDNIS